MAARTSRSETILHTQTNMRFESPCFRAVAISVRLPFLILILNIRFADEAQAEFQVKGGARFRAGEPIGRIRLIVSGTDEIMKD